MKDKFRIGQRVLRKGATRKWWGYDIGLQMNGARVYPRQQSLERVYSKPAPGLQRLATLEKELCI